MNIEYVKAVLKLFKVLPISDYISIKGEPVWQMKKQLYR